MKLTFLGVSSALSKGHNSNILIDLDDGNTLLFDAGITLKQSLRDVNRDVSEIDGIYISHLHSDHCGSMEWLGYYSYFIMKKRLKLHIHETLVSDLWAMLRPAMEKLDGHDMMTLDDYFDVCPIADDFGFSFGNRPYGIDCRTVRQIHVETPHGNMYSYGLKIGAARDDGWDIFISSDSKCIYIPPTDDFTESNYDYNYIFCDCDVMNLSGVHPNYDALKLLDSYIKSKMWLYHYTDLGDKMPDAVEDGFAGFIREGQIFVV